MRLGLGGRGLRPNEIAGYGMMGLGALILLLALPVTFWMAAVGGFLGFLGWSVAKMR